MEAALSQVGRVLKEWRGNRGMSQLDLALSAGVSSRHVSFIETGRSRPSRTMVLRLAETMDLPLRDRNDLLVSAGFAPLYRESALDSSDLTPVRKALDLILSSHDPYPAFVLNPAWDILQANRSHHALLALLFPEVDSLPDPVNVLQLLFDPDLLKSKVGNWETVAHALGHRVRLQMREPNLGDEQQSHFRNLLAYPGVLEAMEKITPPPDAAVLVPLELILHGRRLSWFSTIATIGTPQDVTVEELRIESMFPADEETAAVIAEIGG